MSQQRKQPIRTCIACRSTSDKRKLLRIVKGTDGHIDCDATGKCAGRGAYLCPVTACFEMARKRRLLDRALKTSLNNDDYQRLQDQFNELIESEVTGLGTVN